MPSTVVVSPTLNVSLTPFILTAISSVSSVIISDLEDITPASSPISSQLYGISFAVSLGVSGIPALGGGACIVTVHDVCFPAHVIVISTSP